MRPNHRTNYFIKKDLQGRYVLSYFLFVIAGSIIFAVILSLFSADTITMVYENHDLRLGSTPLVLFEKILSAHWVFVVVGGAIVVMASILLTHRFAGPMYRFEKILDQMTTGDISVHVRLRAKDEGKELGEKINGFNKMLCDKLEEIKKRADDIERNAEVLAKDLSLTDSQKNIDTAIDHINTSNRRIREIIEDFTLKKD